MPLARLLLPAPRARASPCTRPGALPLHPGPAPLPAPGPAPSPCTPVPAPSAYNLWPGSFFLHPRPGPLCLHPLPGASPVPTGPAPSAYALGFRSQGLLLIPPPPPAPSCSLLPPAIPGATTLRPPGTLVLSTPPWVLSLHPDFLESSQHPSAVSLCLLAGELAGKQTCLKSGGDRETVSEELKGSNRKEFSVNLNLEGNYLIILNLDPFYRVVS